MRVASGTGKKVEMVGVGNREGTEKNGVDEAEGGGAGADGESEGKNRSERSNLVFGELAKTENCVAAEGSKPRENFLVADALFGLFEAAEPEKGVAAGTLRGHALRDVVVDVELKMGGEFGIEIPDGGVSAEGVEKALYGRA